MRAARDQVLGFGIGTDADGDALADRPIIPYVLLDPVGLQGLVHLLGHQPQSQLAKGDEVPAPEEVLQRLFHLLGCIDIAALHSILKSFRSEIHHHEFAGILEHPVGDGLPDGGAGDRAYRGRHTLHVLDVHGGENFSSGVHQLEDVLVAFAVLAAGNVRVRQLVHEDHLGRPGQDRIHVHFLEDCSPVLDLLPGDALQLPREIGDHAAAMRLHHSDDHVLAAAAPTDRFAQHAVRLADPRGIAQKELQQPAGATRR
jgi:hypothetical protein